MYDKSVWRQMAAEITSIRAEASHYTNAGNCRSEDSPKFALLV